MIFSVAPPKPCDYIIVLIVLVELIVINASHNYNYI